MNAYQIAHLVGFCIAGYLAWCKSRLMSAGKTRVGMIIAAPTLAAFCAGYAALPWVHDETYWVLVHYGLPIAIAGYLLADQRRNWDL